MNLQNNSEYIVPKMQNGFTQQMRYSLAMNQRKIIIADEVDTDSILEAKYYLDKLRYMDNRFHKDIQPIEIQVNTVGGSVEDGFSLIALIEQMKRDGYTIITTNVGRGYSMGFYLSICGTIRQSYPYSRYMYHDVCYGAYGKHGDILDTLEYVSFFREVGLDLITKYTNIRKEDVRYYNDHKKDKFFSPTEMMELKGVDKIV